MKKISSLIAGTLVIASMNAQQMPLYSQYFYNPFLYNPSLTGQGELPNLWLTHRQQWRDIPGSPVTNALSLDGKFHSNDKIGLGIYLYQDVTDLMERIGLGGAYSYKVQLSGDHYLLGGFSFGVTDNNIDFNRALVMDKDDPFLYSDKRRKVSLDASVGLTYMWKELKVGLSAPQLLGQDVKFLSTESNAIYHLSRHFMASASYDFYISEANLIKGMPSVMFRKVKGAPAQCDINAIVSWKEFLYGGFTFRTNYAVGAHLGVKINKALTAGYYFDYVVSDIGSYSGNGHEFMLGYTFGANKKEEVKTPETSSNDQMVDSMLMILKNENQKQKEEIEKLNKDVEDLKKKQESMKTPDGGQGSNNPSNPPDNSNPSNPGDGSGTGMKKDSRVDYKDEKGEDLPIGYYVVIGAYKEVSNALAAKSKWVKIGYINSKYIFNEKKGLYYVVILETINKDAATSELAEIKSTAPDSWIYQFE